MNVRTPAPPGLRWAASPTGRAIATVLAVLSLIVSLYVGYRYLGLVDCLRMAAAADSERTHALAPVTDAERAAERELLKPGGPHKAELDEVVRAREAVDEVRRRYPAPEPSACG